MEMFVRKFGASSVGLAFIACCLTLIACLACGSAASAETILHYSFTDGSGTTVTDLSGKGNHGTLVDFSDTSAGSGVFGVSKGWVTGGGLNFLDSGSKSYVRTPVKQSQFEDGDFTIEFLASLGAGATGWTPAIGNMRTPFLNTETFYLGLSNNLQQVHLRLPNDPGKDLGTSPYSPGNPTPHHIALTYTRSTNAVQLYIDGVAVGTPWTHNPPASAHDLMIGATGHGADERWDGVFYGVAISTAVLGPGTFVIPEPSTFVLLSMALLGLAVRRTRSSWR